MEQKKEFDIKTIKVYRTAEGTLFEIAFAIVAIIVWGIVAWMLYRAPAIVATHFDASGHPNAYGSPLPPVLIAGIITTVVGIAMMVTAYYPRWINMPVEINNIRQVRLLVRFVRVAGITILLIPLMITYMMLVHQSPLPVFLFMAVLFTEIIVFCMLIHKAR